MFRTVSQSGACAQFCRLAFDLKDSDGKTIEHQKHLLSLKDMSQIDNLETLMRSGACAFKIEGRLKDINYVKNVVSAYSQRINEIIGKYPKEFCRASLGRVQYTFTPDLKKTFNRGYTNYFLNGRQPDIFSPDTPKALGEYVGRVKEIRRDSFNVAGTATFANGDGLCFLASGQVGEKSSGQVESGRNSINPSTVLQGFRVNRAVGNRLYPFKMPKGLKPGMALYRNQDQSFDKELSGTTAVRKIPIRMRFGLTNDGFKVDASITSLDEGRTAITFAHQLAQKPQHDNIVRQLSKLGNTVYECSEVEIEDGVDSYFIPSSILAELRRKVVEQLDTQVQQMKRVVTHRQTNDKGQGLRKRQQFSLVNPSQYNELPYLYNISNDAAREFYEYQGLSKSESAFECQQPNGLRQEGEADLLLMQCRHCIRYSLGYCVKRGGKNPKWHEPLYLELSDKRRFRLEFDCKNCQMNVLPE